MSVENTERQPLLADSSFHNTTLRTELLEEERKTPWYMTVFGIFLVVFAGCTFTGANVIQKIVCEGKLNFWSLFLIRGMTQLPVMGGYTLWTKSSFFGPKEVRRQIFLQGFCGGLLLLGIFVAIQNVPLGNASAIFFCTPVATFIFAVPLLREPLKGYRLMIITFMMSGVALMTRPNFLGFPKDSNLQTNFDGQLWMLNDTTFINKANVWQSDDEWKLLTINDGTSTSTYIANLSNNTVLGIENFDDTVVAKNFDQYKFEEAWIKGEPDNQGFFTLTNMKSRKILTAISAQILKVIDDTNNNEILGYITCCMVPIFSAIVSIWTRQCAKAPATVLMFWFGVGACFWAVVGSTAFGQNIPELLTFGNIEDFGYSMAIVLLGMLGNFSYTMAVKWVSPTKANVFRSFEVILNYLLQIFLEHHSFHPSDILGICFLLMAVFATGFEQEVMKKNFHQWI